MEENKNKKQKDKLYIIEMVLFIIASVINILAMKGIFEIKIANLLNSIMLVVLVFLTKKITKLENGKRSGSIYVVSVIIGISWFITYIAMWVY